MKTVFSGIQPSGEQHLGNYLGASRNWVRLQEEYRCLFCIVDLHALTQHYDVPVMRRRVEEIAIEMLALGIDPERSIMFLQSMVPEHTELCWVLNTVAHYGELERMTQFKDKAEHQPENINVGIFDYPVLQAADILLYKADAVPVGNDQLQHLELARHIARTFNHRFGETFPECQPLLSEVPKLLGLLDERKMSKSFGNHLPLAAFADEERAWALLKPARVDPARVRRSDPGNPDVCNIFTMHKGLSSPDDQAWSAQGCRTAAIGCMDCKKKLFENMQHHFAPFVKRRAELIANPKYVADVLDAGAAKAREIAQRTMHEVRDKLGLWRSH